MNEGGPIFNGTQIDQSKKLKNSLPRFGQEGLAISEQQSSFPIGQILYTSSATGLNTTPGLAGYRPRAASRSNRDVYSSRVNAIISRMRSLNKVQFWLTTTRKSDITELQ